MAGEDIDRCDFAGLVVSDDMDDCDALCRAPEPLPFVQRVMLRFRRDALRRASFFRCVLKGWRKKVSTFMA